MQVAHALFVAGRLDEAADMADKCLAQQRERGQGAFVISLRNVCAVMAI